MNYKPRHCIASTLVGAMQSLNDTKLYVRAAMRASSYQVYTADCNYYSIIVIAVHFFTILGIFIEYKYFFHIWALCRLGLSARVPECQKILVPYENANLIVLFDRYVQLVCMLLSFFHLLEMSFILCLWQLVEYLQTTYVQGL